MIRTMLPLTLFALASAGAMAHEESWITVGADGTLSGLPEQYAPARLLVEFEPLDRHPVRTATVSIGRATSRIPECVTSLLEAREPEQIRAVASWYHPRDLLPHYLRLTFVGPGYRADVPYTTSIDVVLALETAELLGVDAWVVTHGATGNKRLPIDMKALCPSKDPD
jgi:hypothetical protein